MVSGYTLEDVFILRPDDFAETFCGQTVYQEHILMTPQG